MAGGVAEAEGRAALRQGVEDLNLSQEEVKKFNEAFEDPKFLELFADYAREISDPKHKAENDAYLRQIEAENRAGQVYGEGLELVVPEAGFVVATSVGPGGPDPGDTSAPEPSAQPSGPSQAPALAPPSRGTPVYINVCMSDKVAAATSSKTRGSDGASGQGWAIPYTLGGQQDVQMPEKCRTIDFVCHPETRRMCQRSKALLNLVAETALEEVEKALKVPLLREYRIPSETYRGEEGQDKPRVQSIRSDPRKKKDTKNEKGGEKAETASDPPAKGSRSDFSFKKATERPKKKPSPPAEGKPGYRYSSGEVVPDFDLVHRGAMDMAEYWQGQGAQPMPSEGMTLPYELELRVKLDKLKSAKTVDLEVTSSYVKLHSKGEYRLEVQLPHRISEDKGSAKFDKATRTLVITAPVVPPKRRVAMPFREPDQETESDTDEPQSDNKGEPEPEGELGHEVSGRDTCLKTGGNAAASPPPSDAQRAWEALHNEKDSAAAAAAAVATQAAEREIVSEVIPDDEVAASAADGSGEGGIPHLLEGSFHPAETFAGRRPGFVFMRGDRGQGYYADGSQIKGQGRDLLSGGGKSEENTQEPKQMSPSDVGEGSDAPCGEPRMGEMLKPRLGTEFLDDLD